MNEYKIGNATVRVYRPELTERERQRREESLRIGLRQFGKAMMEAECKREVVKP